MRFTFREWRRIGILAALSLLVAGVLVFRGGSSGDETPVVSAEPTTTPVPQGPSAADQVADAAATGSAAVEPDEPEADLEGATDPLVSSGLGTFTGALTGPIQYGTADPELELRFSVAVEDGIGVDATELATIVDQVLADPRSWAASVDHSLVRIPQEGQFQLVVASPETTDEICDPLQTIGQLSCAIDGVVAINLVRWETASRGWTGTLDEYRAWVINHEIGHELGFTHRNCDEPDAVADVMQQQSIDLDGCIANPWPFPNGVDFELSDASVPDSAASADDEPTG